MQWNNFSWRIIQNVKLGANFGEEFSYFLPFCSITNLFYETICYIVIVFDYRFSTARRIVKNAFGILVLKFRIFKANIAFNGKSASYRTGGVFFTQLVAKTTDTYITQWCVDYEDIQLGQTIPGLLSHQIQIRLETVPRTRNDHYLKNLLCFSSHVW